ncbi:hypothetical protein ZIOFF_031492 [Zingiber officinale]|uniref:CRM domain-containing protein n=1 Tax=Zingiber officinale TaxID=94328 RepID=A0A8J5GDB9_ZINOF|nr:hypothetical protein ZIOFF_031492 [Zingiber officinale]
MKWTIYSVSAERDSNNKRRLSHHRRARAYELLDPATLKSASGAVLHPPFQIAATLASHVIYRNFGTALDVPMPERQFRSFHARSDEPCPHSTDPKHLRAISPFAATDPKHLLPPLLIWSNPQQWSPLASAKTKNFEAKKKVGLLLQKLKKYELPELPPPRHDPELLTLEQLQAYKKIGFRNRNYVPVGVRGVFGGVVQNMHLHWKFHETVQVCCDNFPREKIKEMATMIARLSGGIVVNIHDVKTIIMFRGRNYRQPKNLIPINTLTKRKVHHALFKARFEQALESQKLNIKKIEQELRRKGVNPEDPIAMASIQRIATTFFRAIDEKQGTPYIFHGDKPSTAEIVDNLDESIDVPSEDSDQEELDRFIREIEDAADKEWEEEEAVEKEELSRIRYWGKDDMGRSSRAPNWRSDNSEDEDRAHVRRWNGTSTGLGNTERKNWDSDNDMSTASEDEWDYDDKRKSRAAPKEYLRDRASVETRWREHEDISLDGDVLGDSEDAVGESEDEDGHNFVESTMGPYDYLSNEDSEDNDSGSRQKIDAPDEKKGDESWDSD